MRRRAIAAVFFTASLQAVPAAEPLVCFGDSQTVGIREGVLPGQEWCAILAKRKGVPAINKGVGGNTTNDALKRLEADVLSQSGACVTVMFGANDGWRDPRTNPSPPAEVSSDRYKANLYTIVQKLKGAGKQITLMTPWPFFSTPTLQNMQPYVQAAKEVAFKEQVPLVDVYTAAAMNWWNYCTAGDASCGWFSNRYTDYQHPSASGNAEIAALCELPQNQTACACAQQ